MYTGLSNLGLNSISSVFSPTNLFINNEQGFLYINDISTMYQDSAGTLPAVLEQTVGLWLDSRFGAVRGVEMGPSLADSTGWAFGANGSVTGGQFVIGNTSGAAQTAGTYTGATAVVAGGWYEITYRVVSVSGGSVSLYIGGTPSSIFSSSPGTYRQILQAGSTTGLQVVARGPTGVTGAVIDQISARPLPGNHATQPTSANRPTLKQDAKGNYYVHFNGTNQWMQTGSIDFTGTDKVTVFAGVTKLSDAAQGVLVESSASVAANNGTFLINAPNGAGPTYAWFSKGTALAGAGSPSSYAAPSSNVVTGVSNIAGDQVVLRVNGLQVASDASDQGLGNYSSQPVYIGSRGGTSLFFNGDIYCLSARGAQTTDSLIAQMEQWANGRMGRVY